MHVQVSSAEWVLPGHPDKLCDAAVDAVVDFVRHRDPEGQVGLEAAAMRDTMVITGRIATYQSVLDELDIPELVRDVYRSAGYGMDEHGYLWAPDPQQVQVVTHIQTGEFEEGERENRHLSDDQAVCIGYANVRIASVPVSVQFVRGIAEKLVEARKGKGAGLLGPDGKVLARVEESHPKQWTPTLCCVSLQHRPDADPLLLREIVEEAAHWASDRRAVLDLQVNPGGMFVCGGPYGDNGLSGKKLAMDAYGCSVPIGGGAWSGKDFAKVDRLGGMLARRLANLAIGQHLGTQAQVTLTYTPGCDAPVAVDLWLDGKRYEGDALAQLGHPVVDNLSVWREFVTVNHSLVDLARWSHWQDYSPWERR